MGNLKWLLPMAPLALASLSPQQISSFFANTDGLLGATGTASKAFEVALVANASHALVALQLIDGAMPAATAADIGWIGFGSGQSMIGSDDQVFFFAGTAWAASRREPVMATMSTAKDPGPAAITAGDSGLLPALSSVKGGKVVQVTFWRKLDPNYASQSAFSTWNLAKPLPVVYARSSTAPTGDVGSLVLTKSQLIGLHRPIRPS
jgi:hypothetical protein